MKAKILIVWETKRPPPELSQSALELDLNAALTLFLDELGYAGMGLNLLLADDDRLRELNRDFRGKDTPTDVLSWRYLDEAPEPDTGTRPGPEPDGEPPMLGELAISLETARRQADQNGWDLRTELMRLLAHGVVHLAGYDHPTPEADKAMKAIEVRLLNGAGLSGLYPED